MNKKDRAEVYLDEHLLPMINNYLTKYQIKNGLDKFLFFPNINYALPFNEKRFFGSIPYGSFVELRGKEYKKDFRYVFDIWWLNQGENARVDLDLSFNVLDSVINWQNYTYMPKDIGVDVQFSGDVTDAPVLEGASEWYSIPSNFRYPFLLKLNIYAALEKTPINIIFTIGKQYEGTHSAMDEVICSIPLQIAADSTSLNIGVFDAEMSRFFFDGTKTNDGQIATRKGITSLIAAKLIDMQSCILFEDKVRYQIVGKDDIVDHKQMKQQFIDLISFKG